LIKVPSRRGLLGDLAADAVLGQHLASGAASSRRLVDIALRANAKKPSLRWSRLRVCESMPRPDFIEELIGRFDPLVLIAISYDATPFHGLP
jgi:hypothetical protein